MNKKNQKGFTLVELVVVIAIVAILAAVGIVGYTQFIQNARDSKAKAELDQVVNILYAEALVEGVWVLDNEVVPANTTGSQKVLEAKNGKLEFIATLTQEQFEAIIKTYVDDLKGTFTLSANELKYVVDQGTGKAVVVYGGTGFTYTPPQSD